MSAPAAPDNDHVSRAVADRLRLLIGMLRGQDRLEIAVRYRDHSVSSELVRDVRSCLSAALSDHFPGQVSEKFGSLTVGNCRLTIGPVSSSRGADMLITVDTPEPPPDVQKT